MKKISNDEIKKAIENFKKQGKKPVKIKNNYNEYMKNGFIDFDDMNLFFDEKLTV